MKKVYFRKTVSYDLGKDRPDVFQYLQKVGMQTIDPKPQHIFSAPIEHSVIFHSTLSRVSDSFPKDKNDTLFAFNELREILFDLQILCTQEEFEREGSSIVRKRFKEFFIADNLPQKRAELFSEIKKMLNEIQTSSNDTILVVSHSFRLKLIESYVKTNGDIEKNPALIHDYIYDDKKTYDFEQGFDCTC